MKAIRRVAAAVERGTASLYVVGNGPRLGLVSQVINGGVFIGESV